MTDKREVVLQSNGGEVTVEVVVTNQKPAAITVALYGADRRKERVLGEALTLTPPDPDVFQVAPTNAVVTLNTKIVGVIVAISSHDGTASEPVNVISTLRQGGIAVLNGTIVAPRVVENGGAGAILGYDIRVA